MTEQPDPDVPVIPDEDEAALDGEPEATPLDEDTSEPDPGALAELQAEVADAPGQE